MSAAAAANRGGTGCRVEELRQRNGRGIGGTIYER
jgi:hypothetical protein